MPFMTHAGVSLRYDRSGAGPAVLLVHGWTFNRTVWERQVVALRARHTVVTVDLRGHGESSHPRSGYTLPAMAGDLEQLVRTLGVPRIAVVGWSFGGVIALELAKRLGDRLSALALVCSWPGGFSDEKSGIAVPKEEAAQMRATVENDYRGFARQFAARIFKRGAESPFFSWAVAQIQKTPTQVAAACLDTVLAADLRPSLKAVKAPTAVLHGRHDAVTPLAGGELLKKGIKGATLTVFEDSGHAPFLEEPDAFDAALVKFLAG
jgi:pimeloyl-ACP methyl ester esterase